MQWCLLYIREAHASDVWPLKWSFEAPKPKSLVERVERAKALATASGFGQASFRLLVDDVEDAVDAALGAWPTNYYVFASDGTLAFVADTPEVDAAEDGRADVARLHNFLRDKMESPRRARAPGEVGPGACPAPPPHAPA